MTSMSSAALDGLRSQLVTAVRRTCPTWLSDQADDLAQMAGRS